LLIVHCFFVFTQEDDRSNSLTFTTVATEHQSAMEDDLPASPQYDIVAWWLVVPLLLLLLALFYYRSEDEARCCYVARIPDNPCHIITPYHHWRELQNEQNKVEKASRGVIRKSRKTLESTKSPNVRSAANFNTYVDWRHHDRTGSWLNLQARRDRIRSRFSNRNISTTQAVGTNLGQHHHYNTTGAP